MATTYAITPASTTVSESIGTVTFTVTRSGTLPVETLFVSTETGEGSANNADYTGKLNETLAFTSGQTSKTVTVSITNDSVVESSETFGLLVQRNSSDPASTFLAKSTFTIADDDVAATTYSISPGSTTVNESAGTVTFTVTRSGGLPAETLFVSTETGEGFANIGDYTGKLNEQLAFTSGQTSKTVTVSITNDSVAESSETFGILVQRNSGDPASTFLAKSTFTIADDDAAATTTYSISPGSTTVNENAGTVTFTVTRSGATPAETLFVSTETGEGSANNGDYTGKLNEQLAFTSGQTSKTVTVSITNDSVAESSETFGLLVQRNSGDPASTFLAKSTFTIADDDSAGTTTYSISPGSTTVNENAGTVTFTVTRSGATPAETLFVSTETGEGSANNGDYTGKLNEQLTFTSGQTSKTVTVSISNDSVAESSETFGLLVQRNSGDPASTFLAKSTFTIADDDSAGTTYSISPGSTTVNENAGTVTFTVTRSGATPAETLFVSTETGEGSANNGDYTGKLNEQLAFTSGQTSKTVTISITNDSVAENSETFGLLVQRNSSDPASIFLAKSTFTIADDDSAGTIYSVSPSPNPVNENAGTETFTITRSGSLQAETVFASTLQGASNGYDANSSDYNGLVNQQVSFAANQTSAQVAISIVNNATPEPDESFGFIVQRNSTDPVATFLAKTNWTIHDDDTVGNGYSVSADPNPLNENAGTATFTITRSGSNLAAETLFASTLQGASNGYAANGGDYTGLLNQQVSFAANQTTAQVTVAITNDTVAESDDTFGFIVQRNASDPLATYLAKTNWTIHDDDGGTNTSYSVTPSSNVTNENGGVVTFTITRSGGLAAETLYVSTLNGAANGYSANVNDYNGVVNQQVVFAANQTTAEVAISVNNDAVAENDETFGFIVQHNASDSVATYLARTNWTIHDDDSGSVTQYTVDPSARTVVDIGGSTITFHATRSGDLPAETLYMSTLAGGEWSNNNNLFGNLSAQPISFVQGATSSTTPVTVTLTGNLLTKAVADFGVILQKTIASASGLITAATSNFSLVPSVAEAAEVHTPLLEALPFDKNDIKLEKPGEVRVTQQFGEGYDFPWGNPDPHSDGYDPARGTGSPNDHGTDPEKDALPPAGFRQHGDADQYLYYSIDFHAADGTSVLAQGNGHIEDKYTGPDKNHNFGDMVTIRYDNNSPNDASDDFYATYMHLQPDFNYGMFSNGTVKLGDLIGYSGHSGGFAAHLHVTYGKSSIVPYGDVKIADGRLGPTNPNGAPVTFKEDLLDNGKFHDVNNQEPIAVSGNGLGQSFTGSGSSSTISFAADPVTTPSFSLNREGSYAVLLDTDLGKLAAQATNFGEMALNNFKNLIVGALNGTGLLGHTVYFNGADSGDNLDASASDTSIVARGGNGNDILIGGFANDAFKGGLGDDAFVGGPGNDTIDGGAGIDTAVYSGLRSEYLITRVDSGSIQISDLRAGSPDGTDTVSNVQNLQFAENTYTFEQIFAGPTFASIASQLSTFVAATGWSSQDQFPRLVGDVNGDHMADIVGFAGGGINVALANGNGHFAAPIDASGDFAFFHGWTSQDQFPRLLGDVNGDGRADIVGFAGGGVNVALATGDGHFAPAIDASGDFAFFHGWTSQDGFPRLLGDVNGDGMADIVGFAGGGVNVAFATGNGHFAAPIDASGDFGLSSGWTGQDRYPRALGDVNGDGAADIVGFGQTGVYDALSNGFHLV